MNDNKQINKGFRPNVQRLGIVSIVLILLLSAVGIKLAKVQVLDSRKFIDDSTKKNEPGVILPIRGEIYDRNSVPLVTNTLASDIFCEPIRIQNKGGYPQSNGTFKGLDGKETIEGVANVIASVLGMKLADALESVKGEEWFSFIKRNVDPGQAEKLSMFNLKGVYIRDTHKRYYPQGDLASNLLGMTDPDQNGIEGIEYSFNKLLAGEPGIKKYPEISESPNRDSYIIEKPAIHGDWLFLTLDSTMQFIAKQRMDEAVAHWNADAAICVIQDPNSGEILAASESVRKGLEKKYPGNMPFNYQFEPGSVFKGVTTAIGLDCGAIDEKLVLVDHGGIKVGEKTFYCDWIPNPYTGHGAQNLVQAIRNSCNVVFAQYGQRIIKKIGNRSYYNKLLEFGFNANPGTGLIENPGGVQKPEQWYGTSPWNMFFGRGITVTPLQLINAYSAIANNGVLMKPRIVKAKYNPNTGQKTLIPAEVLRQVVSVNTAKRTMNALTQNVIWNNYDTVYKAAMKGYRIAGKTGTANQINPDGGYYDNYRSGIRYNCSFIGILPVEEDATQKLSILVTVVNPKNTYDSAALVGSNVAAPYFRLVAEDVTSLLHITPKDEIKRTDKKITVSR